jgi:hypothetical protein
MSETWQVRENRLLSNRAANSSTHGRTQFEMFILDMKDTYFDILRSLWDFFFLKIQSDNNSEEESFERLRKRESFNLGIELIRINPKTGEEDLEKGKFH